jgi:uncharacterized Rossmann fold enzyme
MIFEEWELIYRRITKDFNFQEENDIKSAALLSKILNKKKLFSIKKLDKLISNNEIIIFGAGHSLDSTILSHEKEFDDKIKIAADGATSALLKNNILPDIIVTDLDGKIQDLIEANLKGSITIIHAHGDNIKNIEKFVLNFKEKIIGTTQTNPKPFENIYNFGGFTDGDRAVYLADHFNAKRIYLAGFDFDGKIGKYSFTDKSSIKLKQKKLKWCKYLIDLLKKTNRDIHYI